MRELSLVGSNEPRCGTCQQEKNFRTSAKKECQTYRSNPCLNTASSAHTIALGVSLTWLKARTWARTPQNSRSTQYSFIPMAFCLQLVMLIDRFASGISAPNKSSLPLRTTTSKPEDSLTLVSPTRVTSSQLLGSQATLSNSTTCAKTFQRLFLRSQDKNPSHQSILFHSTLSVTSCLLPKTTQCAFTLARTGYPTA